MDCFIEHNKSNDKYNFKTDLSLPDTDRTNIIVKIKHCTIKYSGIQLY